MTRDDKLGNPWRHAAAPSAAFAILLLTASAAALASLLLAALAPAGAAELPVVPPAMRCAALAGFDPGLPAYPAEVTSAEDAEVGGHTVCRVRGTVSPQIRFEVRLPEDGWTQRYLQTGCGGLCGSLDIRAPQRACPALERGDFATASTDMGHDTRGATWGASDLQLRVDFAYRGVHATALVAKAIIARFYGQAPRWSYFSGCSDGGREALMEAQRYPADFDGIAAGAPALNFLVQNSFHHAWEARAATGDGSTPALAAADLSVLHAAALAACGDASGLVSDPLGCRFDPHVAECRDGASSGCLSRAAADAAAAIYGGAHDPDGRKLVVGGLLPGSELGWAGVFVAGDPRGPRPSHAGPRPAGGDPLGHSSEPPSGAGPRPLLSRTIATEVLRSLAFPAPLPAAWRLDDLRFDAATLAAIGPMHALFDATDPDLSGYAGRGGRLLMWHGLADPQISPLNSIAYAEAVAERMGFSAAAATLRLFLIPGMGHCGDGDGLTSVDVLSPLMAWVEGGTSPTALVASRSDADAAVGRGRTLYPWPSLSRLRADADPDSPSAWERAEPATPPRHLDADWLGAGFFAPGYERDCGFDGETFACRPLGHPAP